MPLRVPNASAADTRRYAAPNVDAAVALRYRANMPNWPTCGNARFSVESAAIVVNEPISPTPMDFTSGAGSFVRRATYWLIISSVKHPKTFTASVAAGEASVCKQRSL